jgi:hypothetical protein
MTIDELNQEFTRLDEEARALAQGLTETQAHWQPEEGRRWSITQNLQHLAKTNVVYVDSLRQGLRGARRADSATRPLESTCGWFGRWFISFMEPPPRFRVKTRSIVQPPSTGSLREAVDGFLASQDGVRAFAREAAAFDLSAKFKSPFGPVRFAIGTGLLILAAHDRRHLWQARQVMLAPGFPSASA